MASRRYPDFDVPATVQIKLDRAQTHIADLKQRVEAVFKPDAYRFSLQPDTESAYHVLRVHDLPAVDDQWSAIVGDAIHNLRSALDHLAGVLVEANNLTPGKGSKFPIRDKPFTLEGERVLADVPPGISMAARELVEEHQPYTRGRYPDILTPPEARRVPLALLHSLDIRDKHRTLLIVAAAFNVFDMWWGVDSEESGPDIKRANFEPLKENDPVAWFDFHGAEPEPNFDPHPSIHVTLSERPFDVARTRSVQDIIDLLAFVVEDIVWDFREFF